MKILYELVTVITAAAEPYHWKSGKISAALKAVSQETCQTLYRNREAPGHE